MWRTLVPTKCLGSRWWFLFHLRRCLFIRYGQVGSLFLRSFPHRPLWYPNVVLGLRVVRVSRLLFLSSPRSVHFVIRGGGLFLFRGVNVSGSLRRRYFILPAVVRREDVSLSRGELFSMGVFFRNDLLRSLPRSKLRGPPSVSSPGAFHFLLYRFPTLRGSLWLDPGLFLYVYFYVVRAFRCSIMDDASNDPLVLFLLLYRGYEGQRFLFFVLLFNERASVLFRFAFVVPTSLFRVQGASFGQGVFRVFVQVYGKGSLLCLFLRDLVVRFVFVPILRVFLLRLISYLSRGYFFYRLASDSLFCRGLEGVVMGPQLFLRRSSVFPRGFARNPVPRRYERCGDPMVLYFRSNSR